MIDFSKLDGLLNEGCVVTFENAEDMTEFINSYHEDVGKLPGYLLKADFSLVYADGYYGLQPCIRLNELWICGQYEIEKKQARGIPIIPYSDLTHFTELIESELPFQSLL